MDLMKSLELQLDNATDVLAQVPHGSDHQQRKRLAAACDRLKVVIESPVDLTTRLMFSVCNALSLCLHDFFQVCCETMHSDVSQLHEATAVRVAMELGLFDAVARSSNEEFDVEDLSVATGADSLLIGKAAT